MKTKLTTEQILRLYDLGLDVTNLDELLSVLPKKITNRRYIYHLEMGIDHYSDMWYVRYVGSEFICDDLESYQSAEELIDALFKAFVWMRTNGEVKALD